MLRRSGRCRRRLPRGVARPPPRPSRDAAAQTPRSEASTSQRGTAADAAPRVEASARRSETTEASTMKHTITAPVLHYKTTDDAIAKRKQAEEALALAMKRPLAKP